jgi:3-oxoacyl-[acyl-carrier protein] reductase
MQTQRRAIVTGGRGDLASGLAQSLHEASYHVDAPGKAELDVRLSTSVEAYFGVHKTVDLLICNAGLTADALLLSMAEAQWDEVLDVNLNGAFRCARAVLPGMVERGAGHIVFIGSYSGLVGPAGQAHYAAAKAGLLGLTRSIAKEYGSHGIRCNCVLPGFLETKMTAAVSAKRREAVLADHALGRFNTVTDAALFIAQLDKLEAVSGQVFQLDSRC